MRKIAALLLLTFLIAWVHPAKASAAENEFQTVFKDGFYGGMAGALVGGAALVFRDHPGDHLNYISYGAAIGVFVGVTFGIVSAGRSLAEVDDHKLAFHIPAPNVETRPLDRTGHEVVISMDLLTVRF